MWTYDGEPVTVARRHSRCISLVVMWTYDGQPVTVARRRSHCISLMVGLLYGPKTASQSLRLDAIVTEQSGGTVELRRRASDCG